MAVHPATSQLLRAGHRHVSAAVAELIDAPPVVPSQVLGRPTGLLHTPAGRLFSALVEDAAIIVRNPAYRATEKGLVVYRETVAWFRGSDAVCDGTAACVCDRCWPCSFRNVCDVLGLDADAVRRAVGLKDSPPVQVSRRYNEKRGRRTRVGRQEV